MALITETLALALDKFQSGRLAECEQLCRQILAQDAFQPDALHLLGGLAYRVKKPEIAADLIGRALAQRPNWPEAWCNLGNALSQLARVQEAEAAYQKAIALQPQNADAHLNLANIAAERGHLEEAAARYRQLIALRPDYAEAHNNLGNVLRAIDQTEAALAAYQRAIDLQPQSPNILSNLGITYQELGRMDQALECFRKAVAMGPGFPMAHGNLILAMQYDVHDQQEAIYQECRYWNRLYGEPLAKEILPHENDRAPGRRLRIGYVSADFRSHSCSFFFQPLLAHHDRAQFEIFCYAENAQQDHVTEAIKTAADHWLFIKGFSSAALARRIREDRIDILVDLMGYTGHHRLLVFARKPAPVQVTYLGYPGTTGLDTIDYRFTDAQSDPPGMTEQWHTEKLWRLPESFLAYAPSPDTPEVSPLPALSAPRLTLGSFNKAAKISETTVTLWSEILKRLPNARLLLKARRMEREAARGSLVARFVEHGIDPTRLELRGKTPSPADHLRTYHEVDIALDSYPYHGTTTTCEALWMGIPVVTWAGEAHVSRVGASLLSSVGMQECITHSPEEYVERVVALAQDLPRLAELRAALRGRMQHSPLMDAAKITRNIEAAYREMWQKWCQK